jgi:hypothetical protein
LEPGNSVEGVDSLCLPARRRRAQRPDQLREDRASIAAGIQLVAGGAARRVVLCNLRFAERLLADAVADGTAAGLTVRLDRGNGGAPAIVVAAPSRAPAN